MAEKVEEASQEMYLNMGPQHPSTHGVLRVILKLDGEVIIEAQPDIGYLHRGIEKMAEARPYLQIMPLTDRLDYTNSMGNNIAYAMTVEKLLGLEVPERAQYIRVIVAELNRIASHLVAFGASGLDVGAFTPFLYVFRERERVLRLFERICGARLTYNYIRFGGVSLDITDDILDGIRDFCGYFKPKIEEYDRLILQNYIFQQRTIGVGVLSKADALSYGASGPTLRASGVKKDLRKDHPYLVYDRLEFDVPTGENGDSWDRLAVKVEEMRQSTRILEQAVEQIPAGDFVASRVPRMIMPEPGEVYLAVESPRGELGFYLVSDGSIKPYRLKIRSPAYSNLSVLPVISKGLLISDVVVVIGGLDPCFGEVDR